MNRSNLGFVQVCNVAMVLQELRVGMQASAIRYSLANPGVSVAASVASRRAFLNNLLFRRYLLTGPSLLSDWSIFLAASRFGV